jgi:hypothetical protein
MPEVGHSGTLYQCGDLLVPARAFGVRKGVPLLC